MTSKKEDSKTKQETTSSKAIEVLNSYGDASTQEAIDSLHHILRRLETWTTRNEDGPLRQQVLSAA